MTSTAAAISHAHPTGIEAGLRGLDLDAFCRESAVWHFGQARPAVVGCDVCINLRALAGRLGQPELLAPGNASRVGAALAQGLLKSFQYPHDVPRYRHFVHVPAILLTLAETWALLDALPASSRSTLVLTVAMSLAHRQDLAAVVGLLSEMGISVCLSGVDFAAMPFARLPAGVAWLRGKVTAALDPLRTEAMLTALAPAQVIAETGEADTALQFALDVGFLHAVGPAAEAAAHRPLGMSARTLPHRPEIRPATH
jgi:hypothetical protein